MAAKKTSARAGVPREARPTKFTRVRRLAKRGAYDSATLYSILDAATHCHVAHVIDGRPVATPTLHWRHENWLYWHGSAASRMLGANAAGAAVCVTATLIDGFVLARSGFNHSMNYRSAMCFGHPIEITDAKAKSAALEHFLEHWLPGRWATLRPPTRKELAATATAALAVEAFASCMIMGGNCEVDPLGSVYRRYFRYRIFRREKYYSLPRIRARPAVRCGRGARRQLRRHGGTL